MNSSVLAPALGVVADNLVRTGQRLTDSGMGLLSWAISLLASHRVCRRVYLGPLFQRSAVLRGASVRLRGVRALPALGDSSRAVYELDLLVRPARGRSGTWVPNEISVVAVDARSDRPEEDLAVGEVYAAAVFRNRRFYEASGRLHLRGAQRVRLRVGLDPGVRKFRFRYYLELLRQERTARSAPDRGASGGKPPARNAEPIVRVSDNASTLPEFEAGDPCSREASKVRTQVEKQSVVVPVAQRAKTIARPERTRPGRLSALEALTRPIPLEEDFTSSGAYSMEWADESNARDADARSVARSADTESSWTDLAGQVMSEAGRNRWQRIADPGFSGAGNGDPVPNPRAGKQRTAHGSRDLARPSTLTGGMERPV